MNKIISIDGSQRKTIEKIGINMYWSLKLFPISKYAKIAVILIAIVELIKRSAIAFILKFMYINYLVVDQRILRLKLWVWNAVPPTAGDWM